MKPTKNEIKILFSGTFMQKQNLAMKHYGDDEYMTEAIQLIKNKMEEDNKLCNHTYSRSMNQTYPRKCVLCGKEEVIDKESIKKSLNIQIKSLEEQIEKDTDRLDELRIKLFKLKEENK